MSTKTSTFGRIVQHAESAIISVPTSKLQHGDVILVPTVGKRAVRLHDGKPTLVFPRSGLPVQDGRKAGTFADLGQHEPAVIGRVTGGWVDGGETATSKPKAPAKVKASKGRPAKGSQEAKERMAAVRAARKGGSAAKAPAAAAAPSANREHFAKALDALAVAIEELRQVEVA